MTRDVFMADKFGRVFIIIDDMVKFCELVYGNTQNNDRELAELFFKSGKNHGIHIFGGFNSKHQTYLSASNIFKSENHGIHLGGKADNQNVLEINIPLPQKLKQSNFNIGFCVEDKKVVSVFLPEK